VWDEHTGNYIESATGEVLPTWDEALDAIGPEDQPWHVAGFCGRFDTQGVLAGSKDANRCIGYLTKYLTKQLGGCHQADADAQRAHAARLAEALRYQPCSPRCSNWLRYGIQPKGARPGQVPAAASARPTTLTTSATPGAGSRLAQVVRQDAGRPPRRPPAVAPPDARCFGN
jgi:hypothetical protein